MPDTRPIWPDRAMRDYLATIAEVDDDLALRYLVEQWDAAPADPAGTAMAALLSERLIPVRSFKDRAVHLVLASLGQPEGDA